MELAPLVVEWRDRLVLVRSSTDPLVVDGALSTVLKDISWSLNTSCMLETVTDVSCRLV